MNVYLSPGTSDDKWGEGNGWNIGELLKKLRGGYAGEYKFTLLFPFEVQIFQVEKSFFKQAGLVAKTGQRVKTPVTKSEDPGVTPGIHSLRGKNQLP